MKKYILYFLMILTQCLSAQPLPQNLAFPVTGHYQNNTLSLTWNLPKDYYLYADKLSFTVNKQDGKITQIKRPKADKITLADHNTHNVFQNQFTINLPILLFNPTTKVIINSQGCTLEGFCYPPEQKVALIDPLGGVHIQNLETVEKLSPTHHTITQSHSLLSLLKFLGLGILMSFTPCVLPLLPILLAMIVKENKKPKKRAAVYVLGMASAYGLLGLALGFLGQTIQTYLQTIWVLIPMTGLLVYLGLSLCNLVPEIRLPQWSTNHDNSKTPTNSYSGIYLLGMTSTLTLSPCITPPLMAAMSWITTDPTPWFGATALFLLGIGAGLPLLILATTGKRFWPKNGPWLAIIQQFLGILVIGIAIYLISRFLPDYITALLWFSWLAWGLYHLMKQRIKGIKSAVVFGQITTTIIALVMILPLLNPPNTLNMITLSSPTELNQTLAQAKSQHQQILLILSAKWCANCHWMEQHVLTKPQVIAQLKHWQIVKLDITNLNSDKKAIMSRYHLFAPPTWLQLNPLAPNTMAKKTFGTMKAPAFIHWLKQDAAS